MSPKNSGSAHKSNKSNNITVCHCAFSVFSNLLPSRCPVVVFTPLWPAASPRCDPLCAPRCVFRVAAVTCGTVTWWSPWLGLCVVFVLLCYCYCVIVVGCFCCLCYLCVFFLFVVWKFPVCKLEVWLLAEVSKVEWSRSASWKFDFWISVDCSVFVNCLCWLLFGSFKSVSWKFEFWIWFRAKKEVRLFKF